MFQGNVDFSDINISQGSVATCNYRFSRNLLLNLAIKEFW